MQDLLRNCDYILVMLSIPRMQSALGHNCGNFKPGAKIVLGGGAGNLKTLADRIKQGTPEIEVAVSPNAHSMRHADLVAILFILSIHANIGE